MYKVDTARHLQEAYASMVGLPFVPGMFINAEAPFFKPDDEAHPAQDFGTFLSRRCEETAVIRIKPNRLLDEKFARAIKALPSSYDSETKGAWESFFHEYPTHW